MTTIHPTGREEYRYFFIQKFLYFITQATLFRLGVISCDLVTHKGACSAVRYRHTGACSESCPTNIAISSSVSASFLHGNGLNMNASAPASRN